MFENVRAESPFDDLHRMGGVAAEWDVIHEEDKTEREQARLDELRGKLMAWLEYEQDVQAGNRYQMAVDEDFYDGLQWTEEDAQTLMNRGQAPLVFNLIKPAINWLLGTEKRTRMDFNVLPREESDVASAEIKTKLLKYLSDVNRTVFARSEAFASAVKAGIGWLEDGVTREPGKELIYSRCEDWRNVWYDSNSTASDYSDARYVFRQKFVDVDFAVAMFPQHAHALQSAGLRPDQELDADHHGWYMSQRVNIEVLEAGLSPIAKGVRSAIGHKGVRERVRLIECWYRVPIQQLVCRGDGFDGELFDANHAGMVTAAECGDIDVIDHVGTEVRVCLMTNSLVLYEGKSPYKHDQFPLTPVWCYRRKRDNAPYGVVRDVRDAQEDHNKRASKALFLLSVNRVIGDEGVVADIEDLRQEAARPDSVILKRKGYELAITTEHQLAQEHLNLMAMDAAMIRNVAGITGENLGYDSNIISGKGILAKQEQGAVVSEDIFDHLRFAVQLQGEKQLSLLEQFYTQAKVIRIVGKRGNPEWLRINQPDPDTGEYLNDIAATKADFIVDERDYRASVREAAVAQLSELIGKMPPQIGMTLLDLMIDAMDMPNKDEIVARVRKVTGQVDPWADPKPEEQQAMAQAQAAQAQQQQVQTELLQAKARRDAATAEKAAADAALAKVEAMEKAMTVAGGMAMNPQLVTTASHLVMNAASAANTQQSGG